MKVPFVACDDKAVSECQQSPDATADDLRCYLFSYGHDGARWNFEIWAESPEDARIRVSKLAFATYDGELIAKLPASLGLLGRLIVHTQNFFRGF